MPTYSKAPGEAHSILAEMVRLYHPDLTRAEVRIGILFAHAPRNDKGEITGNCLMLHGYPAAAIARKYSLKQRVAGMEDCFVEVDADEWPNWSEEERRAVLDHEAEHFQVMRHKKEGHILSDDLGRPKIKLLPHDFEIGGFVSVARRHGKVAFEVQAAMAMKKKYGQYLFDFDRGGSEASREMDEAIDGALDGLPFSKEGSGESAQRKPRGRPRKVRAEDAVVVGNATSTTLDSPHTTTVTLTSKHFAKIGELAERLRGQKDGAHLPADTTLGGTGETEPATTSPEMTDEDLLDDQDIDDQLAAAISMSGQPEENPAFLAPVATDSGTHGEAIENAIDATDPTDADDFGGFDVDDDARQAHEVIAGSMGHGHSHDHAHGQMPVTA